MIQQQYDSRWHFAAEQMGCDQVDETDDTDETTVYCACL
jgi:hypothetical protein